MLGNVPFAELITFTRASAAWRFNASGVLVQDGNNVPRYDYDPVTLQPRGMRVEEGRTNLLTHSANFPDASWPKTGCSVTGNAALSPDGTSSADKIVEDTSTGIHAVVRNVTVSASTTYTYSVFVKAAERTVAQVQLGNFGNQVASNTVYVNLSTGSFTATDASRTVVRDAGNGWWWVATTVTTTASGTSLAPSAYAVQTMGTSTYTGDGASGIYVWGAQLEAGAFPTSHIPTTTATVTRAAESALITDLTKIGLNPQAGTIYAEFVAPNMAAAANQSIFALSDGTTANRIQPFINAGVLTTRVTTGGAAADFSGAISGASQVHKLAIGCAAGTAALSVDGGAAAQTSPTAFPSVTKLCLGSGADGISAFLNGYLRALRYYPRKLSNAELQALTA
ncbi:phage head spike fiber domain-containing protein [Cupriavidus sp. a3]|uniref:phage head spike fiber domain-containing protein n=1 Tax=Cupriavidus sp. a3 TaxID=3242158 RepID=UPI003D9C1202